MSDKVDKAPRRKAKETPTKSTGEVVIQIPLAELYSFPGHPFKVRDDEAMRETADIVHTTELLTKLKKQYVLI